MDNLDFIPYEQALALKELGFNEPCFGFWSKIHGLFIMNTLGKLNEDAGECLAPLYQQAFRWFREKHNIDYSIYRPYTKNKHYCWNVTNREIGLEYPNKMVGEYTKTYEEAELVCLDKLIEICKNNMDWDKLKKQNKNSSLLETINKEIDFNKLLEKYGPEGLYLIADKLKEVADEDVRNALT